MTRNSLRPRRAYDQDVVARKDIKLGWLADTFKSGAVNEPITKAMLVSTAPWLLAIPCLSRAAHLVETERKHRELQRPNVQKFVRALLRSRYLL
jgi:hypothetical protein